MRYYDLQILDTSGNAVRHWTSHPNGPQQPADPGALQIEFDLLISPLATPAVSQSGGADYSSSHVRVWGIPLADVAQAANLSQPTGAGQPPYTAVLKGGMALGLPLANPAEIGVIIKGGIWRAIGNWIGTDMTLDLYLAQPPVLGTPAGNGVPAGPAGNFTFNWQKGQPMATAIRSTLQAAFPGLSYLINISPQLIAPATEPGIYTAWQNFSEFLNRRSASLLGPANPGYQGVQVFPRDGQIWVTDGLGDGSTNATGGGAGTAPRTVNVAFTDLIGQPTWLGNNTIQVNTVLRGDIAITDTITMPPTPTTIGAQGAINAATLQQLTTGRYSSVFQGSYLVQHVRHVGNYKSPQAMAWHTELVAFQNPGPAVATPTKTISNAPALPAPLSSVGAP